MPRQIDFKAFKAGSKNKSPPPPLLAPLAPLALLLGIKNFNFKNTRGQPS